MSSCAPSPTARAHQEKPVEVGELIHLIIYTTNTPPNLHPSVYLTRVNEDTGIKTR